MFPSDSADGGAFAGFESTVMKLHQRSSIKEVEGKMGLEGKFGQSEVYC